MEVLPRNRVAANGCHYLAALRSSTRIRDRAHHGCDCSCRSLRAVPEPGVVLPGRLRFACSVFGRVSETRTVPSPRRAPLMVSSAVASAIEAMLGTADIPEVTMTSPAAPGVTHQWTNLNAYADEVAAARIAVGFHYRFSTTVGQEVVAVRSRSRDCWG